MLIVRITVDLLKRFYTWRLKRRSQAGYVETSAAFAQSAAFLATLTGRNADGSFAWRTEDGRTGNAFNAVTRETVEVPVSALVKHDPVRGESYFITGRLLP